MRWRAAVGGLSTLATLLCTAGLTGQQPGTVSGAIVDAASGEPVPGVVVGVLGTELQSLTDGSGQFRVEGVPAGNRSLVFRHVAYGEHTRDVEVGVAGELRFEVRISFQAIELSPLVVEVRSEADLERRASGNSINEINAPELQLAARQGLMLGDVLRQRMPGIRFRKVEGRPGAFSECIEYRFAGAGDTCNDMTVVMDGVPVTQPALLIAQMPLGDLERIEVLSPGQAGVQYGSRAANGVLLVETRQGLLVGRGAAQRPRSLARFDWSQDPGSYSWSRVFGASFVGNALALGVTYLSADYCTYAWTGSLQARPRCHQAAAWGTGFVTFMLPGAVSSLAARRAGTTELSRGRLAPSIAFGTLTSWAGHLLFLGGADRGSHAMRAVGFGVLTVGAPLVVTLSDRLFRALR